MFGNSTFGALNLRSSAVFKSTSGTETSGALILPPIPLKNPPNPSSLAPSIGFVTTPLTPLQILVPAEETPLTNPSPTCYGAFFLSSKIFSYANSSSHARAKAPLLKPFPIFDIAPTGARKAFFNNDLDPLAKPMDAFRIDPFFIP